VDFMRKRKERKRNVGWKANSGLHEEEKIKKE
jgi:hypothetical protein